VNEKTLRALVDAGAIKRVKIIGQGAIFMLKQKQPMMSSQPQLLKVR